MNDPIDRQAALRIFEEHCYPVRYDHNSIDKGMTLPGIVEVLNMTPSAQPYLSEAYSKAVLTWLMDYQIRVAELKGRYTPYEVLSWVINDWRKENG